MTLLRGINVIVILAWSAGVPAREGHWRRSDLKSGPPAPSPALRQRKRAEESEGDGLAIASR
jgi:hypothetical protein